MRWRESLSEKTYFLELDSLAFLSPQVFVMADRIVGFFWWSYFFFNPFRNLYWRGDIVGKRFRLELVSLSGSVFFKLIEKKVFLITINSRLVKRGAQGQEEVVGLARLKREWLLVLNVGWNWHVYKSYRIMSLFNNLNI